ncbi:MAG TPA: hypothetical protein VNO79_02355 [Actinomycetota bacterium]|nr:hypothetical protein [Actinomycetota bacterium]
MGFKTGLLVGLGIGYVLGSRGGERATAPAGAPSDLAERGRRILDETARLATDAARRVREELGRRRGDNAGWDRP